MRTRSEILYGSLYKMKIIEYPKMISKMMQRTNVKKAQAHREGTEKAATDKSKALVIEWELWTKLLGKNYGAPFKFK